MKFYELSAKDIGSVIRLEDTGWAVEGKLVSVSHHGYGGERTKIELEVDGERSFRVDSGAEVVFIVE